MISRNDQHVYHDQSGSKWLSVTQQLTIAGFCDFSMVSPANLEHARIRGYFVHETVKLLVYDNLDTEIDSLDPGYRNYVKAFVQFQKDHGWAVFKTEEIVFDNSLRTCGEYDQIGKLRNSDVLLLLDIKATATVSEAVRLQTAAYRDFYNQDPRNKQKVGLRGSLQLLPSGKYKLYFYKDAQDIRIFQCICKSNWWSLSNKIIPLGAKSSDSTYKLCKQIIGG